MEPWLSSLPPRSPQEQLQSTFGGRWLTRHFSLAILSDPPHGSIRQLLLSCHSVQKKADAQRWSLIQSHTAEWGCSLAFCAFQGLNRDTSSFPGQLGKIPGLVLNHLAEGWDIQHPRSLPWKLRFHLEHPANKGVNSYMTSCQDGKGRGSGDRSYMRHRAHGASCCALPREQPANSSEKENVGGT